MGHFKEEDERREMIRVFILGRQMTRSFLRGWSFNLLHYIGVPYQSIRANARVLALFRRNFVEFNECLPDCIWVRNPTDKYRLAGIQLSNLLFHWHRL